MLGQYKRQKTNSRKHTLKLLDQAYEVLRRQKEHTFEAKTLMKNPLTLNVSLCFITLTLANLMPMHVI